MFKVCIIVPCFNESNRIQFEHFQNFLNEDHHHEIHVFFINDGSTDKTLALLENFVASNGEKCKVINNSQNFGKAETIRRALMSISNDTSVSYNYYAFLDADLSTSLDELMRIIYLVIKYDAEMGFGSRVKTLNAKITRNIKRHYLGRIFSTIVSHITKLKIYDTQCGAKVFRHSIISVCFQDRFISKWIFDVEIFIRLRKYFESKKIDINSQIIEIPLLEWKEVGNSKISLKDMIFIPLELIKIKFLS